MSKKKVFDTILLSLTIAYVITKAILSFQYNENFEPIEDSCYHLMTPRKMLIKAFQ